MGKVSRAFFENVIARHLGERRKDVAVGPANGVDVGVVLLPAGRAMISTTDPIYIVPQYGWERAAWFAFHILASDLTTSGVAPEYITMDWNLRMDIEDDQIETMLRVMDRECRKYGAAIVTAHGPLRGMHLPDGRRRPVPRNRPEGRLGHRGPGAAREPPPGHEDRGPGGDGDPDEHVPRPRGETARRRRDHASPGPVRIHEHRGGRPRRRLRGPPGQWSLGDARRNGGRSPDRRLGDGPGLGPRRGRRPLNGHRRSSRR